jgi:iron complex transport system permease protein
MMTRAVWIIIVMSLLILTISPFINLPDISNDAIRNHILFDLRFPRTVFGFVVGAGLAVCGLVFQAMFHNPLATPYTLGVASGAAFGAAFTIFTGLTFTVVGIHSLTFGAFLGALITISFVYSIGRLSGQFSTYTLLLTGVATSFIFSSLIMLMQYMSDVNQAVQIVRWLMGSVANGRVDTLLALLPFVLVTLVMVIKLAPELNLLMAGDDIAISRGVAIKRVRYLLFFVTSLCVGAIVSWCGPIAFVGMMVPHICRLIVGSDHRRLIPASLFMGGSFLVLCDALARSLFAPAELPVGIVTTLLGGPFFLWLLLRRQKL